MNERPVKYAPGKPEPYNARPHRRMHLARSPRLHVRIHPCKDYIGPHSGY